jgi:two-component system cell cycle sensor histidine kinase/response regulator CckA
MSKHRALAIAAAALLLGVHTGVLLVRYGTTTASLWGDWIDTAAPLAGAAICWIVSRRAGPFGRRVWRLVSFSFLLATIGQGLYTYYYDYLHAPFGTLWPSDVLVFFWIVPATTTLFLSPRDAAIGYRWLRFCDFVQVCILALAVELSLVYVPSRWQAAGRAMELRTFYAGIFFFGAIAVGFLIRGLLSLSRTERAFFLRIFAFLAVHATVLNATLYDQASGHYRQGQWSDLPWTFSYCFMIVLAGTWNDSEIAVTAEMAQVRSRRLLLLAQFAPLLIPAIVFPLVLRIAQEQFGWSVFLVMASFVTAGGRLFVVQNQLLISTRELEKNLSLLQGITEGTTDAVFVKDLAGRYLMINSAGARFLGKAVNEVIGKNDSELFVPEVGRAIMERDRKVLQGIETQTYEEFGTAAGVTRLYLSTKGPFRDSGGNVIGLLGICRDITDRKRAEEQVRQSQKKLQQHIEHTPLAVVEWDLNFRVAAWNPAAERIFGYTRDEAIGQHAHFIVPPQLRPTVDKVWQDLLAGKGGKRGAPHDNITKSGRTISCDWYNTPLFDDAGRILGVASMVHDVTESVALEERLRHSQKMEAIGRLAGGVAHDFNNLLTVILGYTQILSDGLPSGRMADSTAQIKAAAERAAAITRQLLAFSRKQVLTPRIIDLNDIVLNLDSLLRRLIGEDVEVFTVPASDLGSVRADPSQIEQVIMNLALNARDAMPDGGKLTLETANVDREEALPGESHSMEPGRYVMLAVSDTGIGMSPEVQARIFEPFFTTKQVGKGTGLGLSTVYGIIKQSGGSIWVYSEEGRGTTFKIYFPRVDEPAQAIGSEKRNGSIPRGTETILLVEDDAQLRQLSSSVLKHCGYRVLLASTPEEGLAVSQENRRDIKLLVTDVVMPRMNGRQLAEQIVKIVPDLRVLYISGYTNDAIVHYGVLDSALWFLAKPFTLSALVAKVREVLDAALGPPPVAQKK